MDEATVSLVVAAISAGAALFGATVGAVISYFMSRLQFRATVLSANRQAWINDLRSSIAELLSVVTSLGTAFKANIGSQQDHARWLERATYLRAKLHLMINPNEEDHKKLVSRVDELLKIVLGGGPDYDETRAADLKIAIMKIAQPLLKREWVRVKRGN